MTLIRRNTICPMCQRLQGYAGKQCVDCEYVVICISRAHKRDSRDPAEIAERKRREPIYAARAEKGLPLFFPPVEEKPLQEAETGSME